jgi:hypothetical protein
MRTILRKMPNRSSYCRGKYTIEIGYPWISLGAILDVERYLRPEHTVLEQGSGGSTIFFSRRCKKVKSYEANPEWADKVRNVLPQPSNVDLVCGNVDELLESVRKEPNEYYDWLLVDIGVSYDFRLNMMKEGIPKLKKCGYMIVDNYTEINFDYSGWDVYTFDMITGKRWGRKHIHLGGTKICIKL